MWGGGGANAGPRAPRQPNGWPGISQPLGGIPAGGQPARDRAKPASQTPESSGLEQGCPGDRPKGVQTHQRTVLLSTQTRMLCPLTRDPRAHLQRVHTHTHGPIGPSTTRCVCSPGRRLSRHLLHPSRNLWARAELWREEGEGRGQRPAKPHRPALLGTLRLQDKLPDSCPGRCPRGRRG